jgi:hypothetical protein
VATFSTPANRQLPGLRGNPANRIEKLIVPRDFFNDDSDEDEDFPSVRKLLSSSIHQKISADAKPSPDSTTEKVTVGLEMGVVQILATQ